MVVNFVGIANDYGLKQRDSRLLTNGRYRIPAFANPVARSEFTRLS